MGRVHSMCSIADSVESLFSPALSLLKSDRLTGSRLTVAIMPVLSVGGAIFSEFVADNGGFVIEKYTRSTGDHPALHGYSPRFDKQPMLYILRFVYDLLRSGVCRDTLGDFFNDCSEYNIVRALKFAYHNQLLEYLEYVVRITDLSAMEGFRAFVPPVRQDPERPWALPDGVHINNDILGTRILHDPMNIFDTNSLQK